jgi:GAF domain-containing protein
VEEAVSGLVATTREPQILHGEQQPQTSRDRDRIQSAVSLPLELADATLIGVLNLSTSVHGQHFEPTHVRLLQHLAPRCARLLQQAQERLSRRDADAAEELVGLLDELNHAQRGLRSNLQELCRRMRQQLPATALQMLLCRADGAWLPLAQVALTAERTLVPPADDVADRILLDRRWELVSRRQAAPHDDNAMEANLEMALENDAGIDSGETVVLVPLVGAQPWGLLVAEFATAAEAERFLHIAQSFIRDLGLLVEAQLQQQHVLERIAQLAQLAHALPQLIAALQDDRLPLELLEQTRRLVSAQRVAFRRVDMAHRRYSPPLTLGVPESDFEEWRAHDAHLTEETLKRPQTHCTTRLAEAVGAAPKQARQVHATVSLPIGKDSELFGVLNIYDKIPQEPWQDPTFDAFDIDMLESLAILLAELLSRRIVTSQQGNPTEKPSSPSSTQP